MAKKLIIPEANIQSNNLLGAILSDDLTVTGLENDTAYVAFSLSEPSEEFTPSSQFKNDQARLWATKLTSPLTDAVAAAYDRLFDRMGDLIATKFDDLRICGAENEEASLKSLVYDAPDLEIINRDWLTFTPFHGWSHTTASGVTSIQDIIIQKGGTGYTYAVGTVSAPTGAGPVQAIYDAVCEGGAIVDWVPRNNGGAGYPYGGSAGIPTITIVGDGTGALAAPRLKMGRIYTGIKPHSAGIKHLQNDISLFIVSTQFIGARGACLGNGLSDSADRIAVSRVSLGATISKWQGGALSGTADIGVYSSADFGHYLFNRNNGANFERYFNGAKLSNAAQTSAVNTSTEYVLLSRRVNDSWVSQSPHTVSGIARSLTADEVSRVYYAINEFLAAMGVEAPATRTVQGSLTASSSLSSGSTITYSIDPSASPSAAHFDIEQVGGMPEASFGNTFVASVTAACAASGGKYTFDGVKTISIVAGTITPLAWTRTVSTTPAEGVMHGFKIKNGVGVLFNQSTQILMQGSPAVVAPPTIRGVNLSGMEFSTGNSTTAGLVPTQAMVDVYASRGFNVIRLPFAWRRVQHELFGALDVVGNGSGDAEKIKALVDYITITKGMYCILDPHDGASRAGVKIGTAAVPVTAYEDYWSKLVTYIGIANQKVIINLTNEPGGIPANSWVRIANSLTAAIRLTGSLQHIQVPGMAATGAHDWVSSGNAAAMLNYFDPANNHSFEVHQYLDSDHSGTKTTCTLNAGSTRMAPFYTWLETNNKKGFLGEVAAPIYDDPTVCTTELNNILDGVNANPRMYGWAAWGGGGYWGTYYNRIEDPATGVDSVVMELLESKL